MERRKKEFDFTTREIDILYALWNAGRPLLASEMPDINPNLKPATVNTTLKRMLDKKMVVVADFVKSGNVFGRRYSPTISLKDFESKRFSATTSQMMNALSKNNNPDLILEELDNLEKIIKEQRAEILKNNKQKAGS